MSLLTRHKSIAYAAVLIGVFGHASSEFVHKLAHVHGPELSVWRFGLGGLGLVGLALLGPATRNLIEPLRRDWPALIGLSVSGLSAGYLLYHWGLDFATVPQVATLVTTAPIFVAIFDRRLNGQPIGWVKTLVGCSALIGVALLFTDGYLARLAGGGEDLFGMALIVVNAALISYYTVAVRPLIHTYGALRITAITTMIAAIGIWLAVGVIWGKWVDPADLPTHDTQAIAALLTIGFWNTTITQYLWIGGLAAVPDITRGSYMFFLKPVIAAFLAVTFLGDQLTPLQLAAIALICGSVLFELSRPARSLPE